MRRRFIWEDDMPSRQVMITSGLIFTLLLTPAQSQQMDMEAMMRWASADVVRYHIVGAYQNQTYIAADGSGLGDVTDHVVIDLTWKLSESKLVGAAIIQNTKSTVTNLRDREPACLPPVLKGEYEHYDLLGVKDGQAGALELQVKTTKVTLSSPFMRTAATAVKEPPMSPGASSKIAANHLLPFYTASARSGRSACRNRSPEAAIRLSGSARAPPEPSNSMARGGSSGSCYTPSAARYDLSRLRRRRLRRI
jgi:hypothetical protein